MEKGKSGETKACIVEDTIILHDLDTEKLITPHEQEGYHTAFAVTGCPEDLQLSDRQLTIELILLFDEVEFLSCLGVILVFGRLVWLLEMKQWSCQVGGSGRTTSKS